MRILTIIITYNGMRWAERCFSSIEKSSLRPDILVVDNGSTDGTKEYIKSHVPSATLVESAINLGFGQANNIGLQYALDHGYDYVYLMNQDAWVMPDTLERLVSIMSAHPDYGVVSPIQLESNEKKMDNNFVSLTLGRYQFSPDFINDLFFHRVKDIYEVSFVMASHWMISAACLKTAGGFSPTFHHYGEDENYLQRINMFSFKAGVAPDVLAVHDREYRTKSKQEHIFFNFHNVWLVSLSTPSHLGWSIILRLVLSMFSKSLEYKSLQPFKEGWYMLLNSRNISKNRKTSMREKCAFLNVDR